MSGRQISDRESDLYADPLGKPLARYGTNAKAFMLMAVAVVLGLSGGIVVANADWLALTLADSQESTAYTFVGWTLLVAGMGAMNWGVLGMGAFFELRRKGVRYSKVRHVTEMRWKEVEDIQVRKWVTVYRGGKRVDWEVYIYGREATIYLSSGFLRLVPSVSELLNMLKSVSGIEVILPETLY
jgi:hypothetical protein